MCGIFGYFNLNDSEVFYDIGKYSETRGKEASGYININQGKQLVKKFPLPFSDNLVKKNNIRPTVASSTRTVSARGRGAAFENKRVRARELSTPRDAR